MPIELPRHVRQLLAELELVSHGTTQSWNSAGGAHGESTAVLPFGESNPPHLWMRDLYLQQNTQSGRMAVTEAMRSHLDIARGQVDRSHVVGETREQEDGRILDQGKGFTASEVALRFNCTPTRVRRVRQAAGHDIDTGKPTTPSPNDAVADRAAEAARMKAHGMSERQIAFAMGEHRTTVTRWLKTAAA